MPSKKAKWTLLITVAAAVAAGGYLYWHHESLHPSTPDAYLRANTVRIAPQVSGPVVKVFVKDNQAVKKGAPLFQIDPAPFRLAVKHDQAQLALARQEQSAAQAAVTTAEAMVAQRRAELQDAKINAKRVFALVKKKIVPPSRGDDAKARLDTAKAALHAARSELERARRNLGAPGDRNARIRAAKAALAQAKLDLSHTRVVAPANGVLANVSLRPGTVVKRESPQFALVESGSWWVEANYKETDLERIRPGQPATVKVDMYPNHTFQAQVESVSPASGVAFSLLPPENATGNWVKVTQRMPVRVHILSPDPHFPLRIGASAEVTIDTTVAPQTP